MGLLNFFNKPKWKHSDSQVRMKAVENMGIDNLETLLQIIREDSDQQVRIAALGKVNDRESIESLLQEKLPEEIKKAAKGRLEEICTDLIISGKEGNHTDELFALISNPNLLTAIATQAEAVTLRCQAVAAIDDPLLLCEILKQHIGKKPALLAVEKIDDPQILTEVAEQANNKSARNLAAKKINAGTVVSEEDPGSDPDGESVEKQSEQAALDLEKQKVEREKNIAEQIQKREALCAQVESLCRMIGEDSAVRFSEIEKEWLADDSELEDDRLLSIAKRYKDVCRSFHNTLEELGNEKRSIEKLTQSCVQIEKYLLDGNLEPAESLLQKSLQELEGFNCRLLKKDDVAIRLSACQKKLGQRKAKIAEITKAEEEKMQAFKDACVKMEELAASSYDAQAEKSAQKLNESWKKLSKSAEKKHEEFVSRFQAASNIFWGNKENFYKEQEWQYWNNKTKKEELCAIVESLKEVQDMHEVSSKLKECQAAWREIGPVHKKYSQKLWSRFKSSCDENYERCHIFYAELDQKRRENLALKEELCVRAEEHVDSIKWKESSDILQGLQKEWKEIGPTVRRKEQVVYKRFKKACDQFFERRNAFYAEQDAGRQDNLLAKEKLCQELENLLQEPNEEHSKAIQEFQKTWKEIGPAPRKDEQKIWKRFRAACDSHFNWLDEQRLDNLQKKIALCEQVETLLAESGDEPIQQEAVDKIAELQQEWKKIGPVPRKDSDIVWKRFSGQCDLFYATRKDRLQEKENKSLKNQILKEKLLQKAGEVIQQQDEQAINAGLMALQEEWKKVGEAPKDQEQQLCDEFESLCNVFCQQKTDRYEVKQSVLDENLKKKEELCLQLERLTGKETELNATEEDGAFDLIEQFKIAREANFLLAGKTDSPQQKREEVLRIQQEWRALGSTSLEHEQRLWKRYRKAIDLFFAN